MTAGQNEIIAELVNDWHAAGIAEGDMVLIHSNLQRTLKRFLLQKKRITPETVLDSFLTVAGNTGTVLFPLFNFDFPKGTPFDFRNTPSQMGALTEAARNYPGAVRTGHPIYSFAVIGALAGEFKGLNNISAYGIDSPFGMLRKLDGKIASLNLPDQSSMTFYHHVEEMNNVPYRYHKSFTGEYTDAHGTKEQRTYTMFVRNIEAGVLTHVNPAGDLLWQAGLYSGCRPDEGSGLRVISARKMFDFVSDIIRSGKAKGILYRLDGENNE